MFCPNCGKENSTEQKFCRACGISLEKTAESLLEQLPDGLPDISLRKKIFLEAFGTVAFGGLLLCILLAIGAMIYAIITKMILTGANPLAGVLLAAFILFAGLTLIYVFFNESLKEKKQTNKKKIDSELTEQITTAKLLEEKHFEPAQVSVTENTTNLLYAESKTRKLE